MKLGGAFDAIRAKGKPKQKDLKDQALSRAQAKLYVNIIA